MYSSLWLISRTTATEGFWLGSILPCRLANISSVQTLINTTSHVILLIFSERFKYSNKCYAMQSL